MKEIIKYIFRIIFFLILQTIMLLYFANFIMECLFIIAIIPLLFIMLALDQGSTTIFVTLAPFVIFLTLCVLSIPIYILIKIAGLFKPLDKLKKYQAFLVVILINIIHIIYYHIAKDYSLFNKDIIDDFYKSSIISVFISYLLYLFFNFLSKKWKIFKAIGYYTSIEFMKDIIKKIKSIKR